MGKSTEPPTCRFCGKAHRGTCMDHEAQGAILSQAGFPATPGLKKAAARAIKGIESSGGSSAVERVPSKQTVGGSTPPPRSKKSTAVGKDRQSSAVMETAADVRPSQPTEVKRGRTSPAGTQAPPVDTTPKPRGRPKTVPDRKAYLAEKARERRAKKKAKP